LALIAGDTASEAATESQIQRLISGPLRLGSLDLLGQQRLTELTRRLLERLLQPAWFQTETVHGQARLYFEDFTVPPPSAAPDLAELGSCLAQPDDQLRDYVCYVLLDFAAVDPELEEAPLAAALLLADELQLGDRLEQLATKELDLTRKEAAKLHRDAAKVVALAR
jgi:hypothetical protein